MVPTKVFAVELPVSVRIKDSEYLPCANHLPRLPVRHDAQTARYGNNPLQPSLTCARNLDAQSAQAGRIDGQEGVVGHDPRPSGAGVPIGSAEVESVSMHVEEE